MATYDELAKQHPGPAGLAYRYLANPPGTFSTGAEVENNTRLVELADQNLLQWGLAGVRGTLDAYRGAAQDATALAPRARLDPHPPRG